MLELIPHAFCRLFLVGAAALAVLSSNGRADAQSSGDVAAAEALFREGRSLMKAGDFEEACPKLEESQKLDPGVGTLANLALCYEKTNRLASAWAKYREATGEAKRQGQKKRARQAAKKADELEKKLHRIVIKVPKSARVEGLTVTRNGLEVGRGSFGSSVPVDMGDLEIVATAPGYEPWTATVELKAGKRRRVIEIPELEKSPELPGEGDDGGKIVAVAPLPPKGPWHSDTVGWILVGSGVALIAGGAIGALPRAGSLQDQADKEEDLEEAIRLNDRAGFFGGIGFGMIAIGGGVAIAGAVKLALNPPDTKARPLATGLESASVVVGVGSIGMTLRF